MELSQTSDKKPHDFGECFKGRIRKAEVLGKRHFNFGQQRKESDRKENGKVIRVDPSQPQSAY